MNPLNLILLLMYLVEPATPIIAGAAQVIIPAPAAETAPDASETPPLTTLPTDATASAPLHAPIDAESPAAAIALPRPASGVPDVHSSDPDSADGIPLSSKVDTDGGCPPAGFPQHVHILRCRRGP